MEKNKAENLGTEIKKIPPPFKVIGRHKASFSVLVSPTASEEDLIQLIFAFKAARASDDLAKMVPLSSVKIFSFFEIYVFTDGKWASVENLKKFIEANLHQSGAEEFLKEYATHIKAHYLYSVELKKEEGCIGYNDGRDSVKNYRQLF